MRIGPDFKPPPSNHMVLLLHRLPPPLQRTVVPQRRVYLPSPLRRSSILSHFLLVVVLAVLVPPLGGDVLQSGGGWHDGAPVSASSSGSGSSEVVYPTLFPAGGFVNPLPARGRHRGRGAPDQRMGSLENGYPPSIYTSNVEPGSVSNPAYGNGQLFGSPTPPADPPAPPNYKRSDYHPYTSADTRDYSKTGGLVKNPCRAKIPRPIITKLSTSVKEGLPPDGRLTIWGKHLGTQKIGDIIGITVNGGECTDIKLGVAVSESGGESSSGSGSSSSSSSSSSSEAGKWGTGLKRINDVLGITSSSSSSGSGSSGCACVSFEKDPKKKGDGKTTDCEDTWEPKVRRSCCSSSKLSHAS